VGKARSLPLEQSAKCSFIQVSFGLGLKYYTKIEVTNNDKHSNLPQCNFFTSTKSFIVLTFEWCAPVRQGFLHKD
jgi:hypothetical protein